MGQHDGILHGSSTWFLVWFTVWVEFHIFFLWTVISPISKNMHVDGWMCECMGAWCPMVDWSLIHAVRVFVCLWVRSQLRLLNLCNTVRNTGVEIRCSQASLPHPTPSRTKRLVCYFKSYMYIRIKTVLRLILSVWCMSPFFLLYCLNFILLHTYFTYTSVSYCKC